MLTLKIIAGLVAAVGLAIALQSLTSPPPLPHPLVSTLNVPTDVGGAVAPLVALNRVPDLFDRAPLVGTPVGDGNGGLVCRLVDARGQGVCGARVSCAPAVGGRLVATATTDAAATARFEALVPGDYAVLSDRANGRTPVSVRAGEVSDVTITIPIGLTVRCSVLHRGHPAPGAEVYLQRDGLPVPEAACTRADEHGMCVVAPVASGSLLWARNPDREPSHALEARGSDGEAVDLVFELGDTGCDLRGVVRNRAGRGVAARVAIASDPRAVMTTDDQGVFTFHGLRAQPAVLTVDAYGYRQTYKLIDLQPGANDIVIELDTGVDVVARVVTLAGSPVARARVDVVRDGASIASARSDEQGVARLANVREGQCMLVTEGESGYGTAEMTLVPGGATRVDLVVAPGATFEALVVDAAGVPRRGLLVVVTFELAGLSQEPRSREARTDATGRVRFEAVPDGGALSVQVTTRAGEDGARSLRRIDDWRGHEVLLQLTLDEEPSVQIKGKLVDERGEIVRAALVSYGGPGIGTSLSVRPDTVTGEFLIGPLLPRTYAICVDAHGFSAFVTPMKKFQRGETLDLGTIVLLKSR